MPVNVLYENFHLTVSFQGAYQKQVFLQTRVIGSFTLKILGRISDGGKTEDKAATI